MMRHHQIMLYFTDDITAPCPRAAVAVLRCVRVICND